MCFCFRICMYTMAPNQRSTTLFQPPRSVVTRMLSLTLTFRHTLTHFVVPQLNICWKSLVTCRTGCELLDGLNPGDQHGSVPALGCVHLGLCSSGLGAETAVSDCAF